MLQDLPEPLSTSSGGCSEVEELLLFLEASHARAIGSLVTLFTRPGHHVHAALPRSVVLRWVGWMAPLSNTVELHGLESSNATDAIKGLDPHHLEYHADSPRGHATKMVSTTTRESSFTSHAPRIPPAVAALLPHEAR